MALAPLHNHFIELAKQLLPEWKYIGKHRHFKKASDSLILYIHFSFINHVDDFDVTTDVAIEYRKNKERICIIGAEIGNIQGIGQKRHNIRSISSAKDAIESVAQDLTEIGMPFLEKYRNPSQVIRALEDGGAEAMLISPFIQDHAQKISALKVFESIG